VFPVVIDFLLAQKERNVIQRDEPALVPAFDDQEAVFSSAFDTLRDAIRERVFPAASVAVTQAGNLVAVRAFGKFLYDDDESAPLLSDGLQKPGNSDFLNTTVRPATLFDLASLTKVLATTTMAMLLHEHGLLELDAPIIGTVPEFLLGSSGQSDPRRHDITFRMLLAHSSGLPAYEKLFLQARSHAELVNAAFTIPLTADPGTRAEYSDIGFIILGIALERLAQEKLDAFCQREIFGPLAMTSTTFNPSTDLRQKIPPTADEREDKCGAGAPARELRKAEPKPGASKLKPRSTFRRRVIQGEVQDENAFVLGGVAGHAGLFSTAEDVARFAHTLLQGGASILRPETVSLFTRRDTTSGTSRALGWDTPSNPSQSGKYFGANSFGHLGYTGTSLWIDPDRQLSVTLLTNRTWPDCSNQAIKQLRPKFHDAVIESLDKLA
jgi:CubicO group peptidase (beta-lactamase class C family)